MVPEVIFIIKLVTMNNSCLVPSRQGGLVHLLSEHLYSGQQEGSQTKSLEGWGVQTENTWVWPVNEKPIGKGTQGGITSVGSSQKGNIITMGIVIHVQGCCDDEMRKLSRILRGEHGSGNYHHGLVRVIQKSCRWDVERAVFLGGLVCKQISEELSKRMDRKIRRKIGMELLEQNHGKGRLVFEQGFITCLFVEVRQELL
jgi:hypothetical protein